MMCVLLGTCMKMEHIRNQREAQLCPVDPPDHSVVGPIPEELVCGFPLAPSVGQWNTFPNQRYNYTLRKKQALKVR
jgi:hypothetical protein